MPTPLVTAVAALVAFLSAASTAWAAPQKMAFMPPPVDSSEAYDTTPRAPGSGVDYVQFARDRAAGAQHDGEPLAGELWIDPETITPGRPAILLMHGSIVDAVQCGSHGRGSMSSTAAEWAQRGYIVFNIDWRMAPPRSDVVKDPALRAADALMGTADYPGDCAPDFGVGADMRYAQASAQAAVVSLKEMLGQYAEQHPEDRAFAHASRNVAAIGHSLGGHLATRLALRSNPPSGDRPSDRIVAAVGTASVGDCTPRNSILDYRKIKVGNLTLETSSFPASRMWGSCDVVTPMADAAPIRLYNAVSAYRYWSWTWRWAATPSPFAGSGGWNPNLGWDGIVDARWPNETCGDVTAAGGDCKALRYQVADQFAHNKFPRASTEAQTNASLHSKVYGGTAAAPQATPDSIESLLRSVAVSRG